MTTYKLLKPINSTMKTPLIYRFSLIALLVIFFTGCDQSTNYGEVNSDDALISMNSAQSDVTSEAVSDVLKEVKKATARYNSTTQAIRAGYEVDEHCVAVDGLGGMGYHWVNGALIDPVFDPAQPEALLYEADKNGNLKLVGVEYIVINIGQDHPHFGDHPFDVGGVPPLMEAEVPHWSLHVWVYKNNPNGIFTPFNPDVSCPAADEE